jgi:alpha-N-arabinofuranosidase
MVTGLMLLCGVALSGLENAGFEAGNVLAGWKTWLYKDGRDPVLRPDASVFHEGRQSLLIEASEPADVAVGQTVALPAGSVWRARCWIKTENLVARDATDVGAALHVQTDDGATLARGASRFGSSDWREEQVVFRVPPAGAAKITLFFLGYGKGTGKVWFDDVRIEEVAADGPQTIEITLQPKGPAPIDVKQGGQFIEVLCNLIPSMTAQQVAGDSFEEELPWHFAFEPETDKPHRPWYPSGAVHVAEYALDTQDPFNGRRSQRITLPVLHARAGISQDGFYTSAGMAYRLRLHMRGAGDVSVFAALHGGGGPIAGPVALGKPGGDWEKTEARLVAQRAAENATLTIEFEGPGTLWLDRVSLIGEDAVLGIWRPDVVAALKDLNPGVIRFGGSALEAAGGLEWDKCVGPWDQRVPILVQYWGGLEPNFANLEEIVRLCRHIGAEPLLCVRWTDKTPADAAAEVEYFNSSADTPPGRRRAQNGHPEPYGVKYWQIGNEVGGDAYHASLEAFAAAMKKADPTIKLISSSTSGEILKFGGGYLDYLCDHHYGCDDLIRMEESFRFLRGQVQQSPEKPVRAAITEWNTTAGDWGLKRATLLTLSNALSCARYHNLIQRHADLVEITIRSNLADSFCSGVIQPGPGWLYLTPTYYAQQLYSRAAGSYPLQVNNTAGIPWPLQEPDLAAAVSADGRTLRVYGVNSTPKPLEVTLRLPDSRAAVRSGVIHVLRDRDGARTPEIMNTRDDPRRVVTRSVAAEVHGKEFRHVFDPFSLTLFELELGG